MAKPNSVHSHPNQLPYHSLSPSFYFKFCKRVIYALGVSNFLPLHYSQSGFCSHSSLKMGKTVLAKINLIFRLLNPTDTSQSHLRWAFWCIFQLWPPSSLHWNLHLFHHAIPQPSWNPNNWLSCWLSLISACGLLGLKTSSLSASCLSCLLPNASQEGAVCPCLAFCTYHYSLPLYTKTP